MNAARTAVCVMELLAAVMISAPKVKAEVVTYTLDSAILDENNAQLIGTFTWTYDVGDFENGVGQFVFLDVPFTTHDHTDLDAVFDVGNSIEITLAGSVHDDGVDITLFLLQPLTPTTGASVDLGRSAYSIGGNGFHDGLFLSGDVLPVSSTGVDDQSPNRWSLHANVPNPFNPNTTIQYDVADAGGRVTLQIYDVAGRLVRTLVDEVDLPGVKRVVWSGRSNDGTAVATGVYFCRMTAPGFTTTRKMVLVK